MAASARHPLKRRRADEPRARGARAPRLGLVLLLSLAVCGFCAAAGFSAGVAAEAPAAHGSGGAVASDDALATGAGLSLLRAGGNAVDAAVGTALALAVTLPEAGNLLGGGFAVLRVGDEVAALDFREVAPAAATATMYLDAAGVPRPEASTVGPLAAGVPGTPAGLFELHRRFGRLAWSRVVAPAERLARQGYPLSARAARSLAASRELLARFPSSAAQWLVSGQPPAAGTSIRLPELAATLAAYARRGPPALLRGARAAAILEASRRAGGILTAEDLVRYAPVWRQPLRGRGFGWEIAGMPLPSSGGVVLLEALGLLERTGWGAAPRGGADRAHLLAESLRIAFADRFPLGDPASSRAAVADLLAPGWMARRASGLDLTRATPSSRIRPFPADLAREPQETTHLSSVDADGTVVALTTTLNELFGCGLWIPEVGQFLNNEMDDFTTAPGRPNSFDLIQGEGNAVAPGRRMLSSMAPTLAWRGAESIALGGRGGSRIPTSVLQVLLALLADGDALQAAVDRPRLHHQWLPDRLEAETDALSPETRAELERRGHLLVEATSKAKVNAVRRLPDGTFAAAADPRGPGGAGVVRPAP